MPLYRNDDPGTYPPSWYAASAELDHPRPALEGDRKADVAIVGAGYTGLTAALTLAEKGYDVALLEAHRVAFGASGRNGGHVTAGYNKGQQWLEARLGSDEARRLWHLAEEAKTFTRRQVQTHAPEARWVPGVLQGRWSDEAAREERDYVDWLRENYGYECQWLDRHEFQEICRSPVYAGGVLDMNAGHIHPLRYALGLARAAEAAGATIYETTEVTSIEGTTLSTPQGKVTAGHVVLAGNGYLPGLHRRYASRVMPINSFIAATEPLGEKAEQVLSRDVAVSDDKFVVNYFRLTEDKRLLFGGRESYSVGFPKEILPALRARMERLFPQLEGVGIDHHWGGTLGITMTRLPYVRQLSPGVLAAGGFSGHGVALSGFAGRVMAEAIAGRAERFDTLANLPATPFPGGAAARAPLLALAMTWYSLRDRLGI